MNQRWGCFVTVDMFGFSSKAAHFTVMHNSGQSKKLMYIVYLSFLYCLQTLLHFLYTHRLWGLNAINC